MTRDDRLLAAMLAGMTYGQFLAGEDHDDDEPGGHRSDELGDGPQPQEL